jgi:hypothetical protein
MSQTSTHACDAARVSHGIAVLFFLRPAPRGPR